MNNDKSTAIGCFITAYIIATIIIGATLVAKG